MTDSFKERRKDLESPCDSAESIDASASDDTLTNVSRAIYVGTGGNLSVQLADNTSEVTFTNVQDGTVLPIRVAIVRSTSTATDLVGIY